MRDDGQDANSPPGSFLSDLWPGGPIRQTGFLSDLWPGEGFPRTGMLSDLLSPERLGLAPIAGAALGRLSPGGDDPFVAASTILAGLGGPLSASNGPLVAAHPATPQPAGSGPSSPSQAPVASPSPRGTLKNPLSLTPDQQARNIANARTAMSNPEMFALMQSISQGEGDYDQLNGGSRFTGWDYPRYADRAAGAFQIIPSTYDRLKAQLGLTDFSPDTQDVMATHLITGAGALSPLLKGDLPGAVAELRGIWTSLPGGQEQNASMDEFQARYDAKLRQLLGQ